MKLLRRVGVIWDHILNISIIVSGSLIVIMVLMIFYSVIMRYIFHIGQGWTLDIVANILVYTVFFGVAWIQKEKGHIQVDLLYIRQNQRTKLFMDIFTTLISAVICLVLMWYFGVVTLDDFRSGIEEATSLKFPRGIIISGMTVGFLMLSIEFIRQLYGHLASLRVLVLRNRARREE